MQKMVGRFRLIRNFLPNSNGCKLVKNAHCFANLRKHLCFCLFIQQRKFFYSTERTFSPKQLQIAPIKDVKKVTFSVGKFLRIGLFYFFYCLPHQFIKVLQFHQFRQCGIRVVQFYKTVKFFRSGKILH